MLGCITAPGAIGVVGAPFALRRRGGCSLRCLAAVRSTGAGVGGLRITAPRRCLRAAQFSRVERRAKSEEPVSGGVHAVQHVNRHGPTTAGGGFAAGCCGPVIFTLCRMNALVDRPRLLLSLQRALLSAVHPQLREASIEVEASAHVVRVRFEYEGAPTVAARESCSVAATEVIADFPAPWHLEEEHLAVPMPAKLSPLAHVAFLRAEGPHVA